MSIFNRKLKAQVAALEQERDAARTEAAAHAARLREIEPTIEQRAGDRAIELLASAGLDAPISTRQAKAGNSGTPTTKAEFLAAYQAMEDPAEAGAYFSQYQHLLN